MSFDTTTATKTTRNHLHGDLDTSATMRATMTMPTRATTTTTTTRSHLRGELGDINVLWETEALVDQPHLGLVDSVSTKKLHVIGLIG